MKRFFLFFLFYTICSFSFGQNLIPNPSAEDYIECPSSVGGLEIYLNNWEPYRGSPDYWNSCSENPLLGWNNSLGYQEPRTGNGYLGLFTFRRKPSNSREYFGISLDSPLTIGFEYHLSFYVSRAHKFNAFNLASNNIGVLLMTTNYLNPEELGPTPNQSNYHVETIIEDTVNWVNISYQFIADSAYQHIVFGNFYNDSSTDTLRIGGETDGNVTSYYYFDDFCLSLNPNECDIVNSSKNIDLGELIVWPNPFKNEGKINVQAPISIDEIYIYNLQGKLMHNEKTKKNEHARLSLKLPSGFYTILVLTETRIFKKRFVVSN